MGSKNLNSKGKKLKCKKKYVMKNVAYFILEEDIDIAYDHYSPEVQTIFLKEDPDTTVRVTHEAVKHISDKIKKIEQKMADRID